MKKENYISQILIKVLSRFAIVVLSMFVLGVGSKTSFGVQDPKDKPEEKLPDQNQTCGVTLTNAAVVLTLDAFQNKFAEIGRRANYPDPHVLLDLSKAIYVNLNAEQREKHLNQLDRLSAALQLRVLNVWVNLWRVHKTVPTPAS